MQIKAGKKSEKSDRKQETVRTGVELRVDGKTGKLTAWDSSCFPLGESVTCFFFLSVYI